ncbi:VOC family protein [Chitinophaga barathri]|uniref:VOC family protein n=1 Tax=Chitinophaga barathri TaxID=1647451 RepID=A0A3N4MA75_9BACT|nr:VOC family protein [Chitinophaga barathri]RPD38586.1 VOC family protein [Chitinophaga barathri]
MAYITGIQQIGIGVKNVRESMLGYKDHFGMNVLIFDDTSEAALMTPYTGGTVYRRRAVLSLNMQGGGGFEIWQFQDRQPAEPLQKPQYGDLGIYAAKIKCRDLAAARKHLLQYEGLQLSENYKDAEGHLRFQVTDANNNHFEFVPGHHWFHDNAGICGGVSGAVIGVRDMDKAIAFYRDILGIRDMIYDETTPQFRKVLLRKHPGGIGAFNKLLGSAEIELVQALDREPVKIYDNRFWGDCGFIHLCFDVINMAALKEHALAHGYTFSIDSEDSFAMESAAGRFCYIEDPDGTLIELVETHKVPLFKKWGLYLNLKKRSLEKPLPDWMIRMLSLSRVK